MTASLWVKSLLSASLALAAMPCGASAASPVEDYLAARDAYLKQFKDNTTDDEPTRAAYDRARHDLQSRLQLILGTVRIAGFGEPKLNLDALSEGDQGFGLLDGLVYASADDKTSIVVTTDELLDRWLVGHKKWWGSKDDMPASTEAALKSEAFYTQALNTDAAFFKFADIPLGKPGDASFAYAALVGRAQDLGLEKPDEILVLLRRGGRTYVVSTKAAAKVGAVPACVRSWEKAEDQASAARDDKPDKSREDAYRAYRRCFAAAATHASYFSALVKQAKALIDILPQ
ncbi:MAG TPA: hypothetical protein VLX44_18830 [Xanthobacteraceae bacterium]|nr:hypothetical protein [Xanthobacteraceae bacterium]